MIIMTTMDFFVLSSYIPVSFSFIHSFLLTDCKKEHSRLLSITCHSLASHICSLNNLDSFWCVFLASFYSFFLFFFLSMLLLSPPLQYGTRMFDRH